MSQNGSLSNILNYNFKGTTHKYNKNPSRQIKSIKTNSSHDYYIVFYVGLSKYLTMS